MRSRPDSTIWPVVHEERRSLVRDLGPLSAQQWQTPSLCPGWTVHDVVAHLVDSARTTRLGFVGRMVRARFDFDRDNALGVDRQRADDPRDTLARFEAVVGSTSTPPVNLATRLVEAFVHGEDVRRPLGIRRTYPPASVVTALAYQATTSVAMGGGKERIRGWRLTASDATYEHGRGPEVSGSALALLLSASGRPVGADELTGPGAAAFLEHLAR